MSLDKNVQKDLLDRGYSRRQVARIALGAAAVLPFFHEFAFAQDDAAPARGDRAPVTDPDVVRITSNENPMGPSKEGLEAIAKVSPLAWRYTPAGDNTELMALLASTEGVKQDYVLSYPGLGNATRQPRPGLLVADPRLGHGVAGLRQRRQPGHRQQGGPGAAAEGLHARCRGDDQDGAERRGLLRLQPEQPDRHA